MTEMVIDAVLLKLILEPRSGRIQHAEMEVECPPWTAARLSIDLMQPVEGDTRKVLAFELGRLGRALIQVSQEPSLLKIHDR